jgi:hypothetical protein
LESKRKSSSAQTIALILILGFCIFQYYENQRLVEKYNKLVEQYDELAKKYDTLTAVALFPPYSKISAGNITWCFYDLSSRIVRWTMPIDSYRYYVSVSKPTERITLSSAKGLISTYDMRPYVQPSFFRLVIGNLTQGRSDREFVKEVDNIKNQIVVYGSGIGQAPYQFPAETLTEGRGVCADTTILMASMLIEGNRKGNFNFRVFIVYAQSVGGVLVSQSQSLTEANHAVVQVEFSDGTSWLIETTTNYFSIYSQSYVGWKFEVTAIDR